MEAMGLRSVYAYKVGCELSLVKIEKMSILMAFGPLFFKHIRVPPGKLLEQFESIWTPHFRPLFRCAHPSSFQCDVLLSSGGALPLSLL